MEPLCCQEHAASVVSSCRGELSKMLTAFLKKQMYLSHAALLIEFVNAQHVSRLQAKSESQ